MKWVLLSLSGYTVFAYLDYRLGKDRPGHQFFRTPSGERKKGTASYCRPVSPEATRRRWQLFISRLRRSSTLENWVREFARFAPSLAVQTYYGSKDDRPFLRQTLLETLKSRSASWDVLITTYNLATGDDKDRKFLRKIEWDVSKGVHFLRPLLTLFDRLAFLTKGMF